MSHDNSSDAGSQGSAKAQFGKLFVGQVPAVCTEEMLAPLFQPYGNLLEIKVMRDSAGRSKGCAWVRYETQQMAQQAIDALHEKHTIPPQTNTLQVRYAHTPRDNAGGGHQHGGGGGGRRGGRGGGGYHQQHPQQHQTDATPDAPVYSSNNPYAAAATLPSYGQYSYNQGGGFSGGYNNNVQWPQYGGQAGVSGRMPMSPPGLSVFVGNLPPSVNQDDLRGFVSLQMPHANVTAVHIHRDRRFGFVTFETPQMASEATQRLNGCELHDRKIRVEITQHEPKPKPMSDWSQMAH